MIVVDASALVDSLAFADSRGARARAVLARDPQWTAPEHWLVEVFSGLRGLVLGGALSDAVGARLVAKLPRLAVVSVPVADLLPRMWSLRSVVSGYDAAYVSLAESACLTLVTVDAGLARTASGLCRVELAR